MLKKSLVAVALGATITASLPVMAATWGGTNLAGPVEVSGTITAVTLPGVWEWGVGGKTDFAHDVATTPLINATELNITLTDDLPILAGRITSPILGGSGANVQVTYPDVAVGGGQPGYVMGTTDQSIIINAPVTIPGKTGVAGYAKFNASGAGISYSIPVALSATYDAKAVAPTDLAHLCAGIVGKVENDTDVAYNSSRDWLMRIDPLLAPNDNTLGDAFLTSAKLIDPLLTVVPTIATAGTKLSGVNSRADQLVSVFCGVGVKRTDTVQIFFNDKVLAKTDWVATLTPTVTYN